MNSTLWAVIYTDGQLDLQALDEDCRKGKCIPVASTRPKNDPDAIGTILLFHRVKDAQKFIRYNIQGDPRKKDWLYGVIELPAEDIALAKAKFPVEEQGYARKMLDHPTLELHYEMIDVLEVPTLSVHGGDFTKAKLPG